VLLFDRESGIRDPGSGMDKNQDPGSGINIPDPQHWKLESFSVFLLKLLPSCRWARCCVRPRRTPWRQPWTIWTSISSPSSAPATSPTLTPGSGPPHSCVTSLVPAFCAWYVRVFFPVLGIRIRIYLGLPDPDPLALGTDPDLSLFS
jgi:hypothetical protein